MQYKCPLCGAGTNQQGNSFESVRAVVSHINATRDETHADSTGAEYKAEIEASTETDTEEVDETITDTVERKEEAKEEPPSRPIAETESQSEMGFPDGPEAVREEELDTIVSEQDRITAEGETGAQLSQFQAPESERTTEESTTEESPLPVGMRRTDQRPRVLFYFIIGLGVFLAWLWVKSKSVMEPDSRSKSPSRGLR